MADDCLEFLSPFGIDRHSQDGLGLSDSLQPARLFDVSATCTRKNTHTIYT